LNFFEAAVVEKTDDQIYTSCKDEGAKTFESSFLGRFDHFLVARPLYRPEIRCVVDLQILQLISSLSNEWGCPIDLEIDEPSREFITDESNDDPTKGARLVEKKIKQLLLDPLTSLRATGQLNPGDRVEVNLETVDEKRRLVFYREEREELAQCCAAST